MLKKLMLPLVVLCAAPFAWAGDAKVELQQQLAQLTSFNSSFVQTVTDANGKQIQQGEGTLAVSRPDRFRWQLTSPDDELVVSNGEVITHYSAFIEQATLYAVDKATAGTPFRLLASANDDSLWQGYQVTAENGGYLISASDASQDMQALWLKLDGETISAFEVRENTGQRTYYQLGDFAANVAIGDAQFSFNPPAGTVVDDQR